MSNIVKAKDFTYGDLKEYGNRRACDGNWSTLLGLTVLYFMSTVPKGKRNKKDKYVKEHIGEVFNLEDYPNMAINIDTGEIYKNEQRN